MKYCLLLFFIGLFLQGCDNFPQDPEHTLEKVTNDTLVVGYAENPPWVVKTAGGPAGIEPELLKGFAQTLNAEIRWKEGTEQNLLESLEKKEVHVVVSGMTSDTPWKNRVALTRPFYKQGGKQHVMALITGENAFLTNLEKYLYQHQEQIKEKVSHEEI